jgi:hypothetical protein
MRKIRILYLKQLIVLLFNCFHEGFYDRMKFFWQAAHVNYSPSNGSLSAEWRWSINSTGKCILRPYVIAKEDWCKLVCETELWMALRLSSSVSAVFGLSLLCTMVCWTVEPLS